MTEKSSESTITILQPMKTNALFSKSQRRLAVSQYINRQAAPLHASYWIFNIANHPGSTITNCVSQ